jgi:hypothetical protein
MVVGTVPFVLLRQIIISPTMIERGVQVPFPWFIKLILGSVCLFFCGLCCRMVGSFLIESIVIEEDLLLFTGWYGRKRIFRKSDLKNCRGTITASRGYQRYQINTPKGNIEFYETISDLRTLVNWLESAGVECIVRPTPIGN